MINPLFCHGMNYLHNQVPLGIFLAQGAKWGCMTKNHCHVMAIVMRKFLNSLRNTKWSLIRLLSSKAVKNHEKKCHNFGKI